MHFLRNMYTHWYHDTCTRIPYVLNDKQCRREVRCCFFLRTLSPLRPQYCVWWHFFRTHAHTFVYLHGPEWSFVCISWWYFLVLVHVTLTQVNWGSSCPETRYDANIFFFSLFLIKSACFHSTGYVSLNFFLFSAPMFPTYWARSLLSYMCWIVLIYTVAFVTYVHLREQQHQFLNKSKKENQLISFLYETVISANVGCSIQKTKKVFTF